MYFSLFTDNFHTLALEGVPIFGLHNRTAAYRFVTLVDVRSMFLCFFFYYLEFDPAKFWLCTMELRYGSFYVLILLKPQLGLFLCNYFWSLGLIRASSGEVN